MDLVHDGSVMPQLWFQRLVGRILKGFALLAMSAVVGGAALLAVLWLEHRTDVTLPAPTGSFAVGRATFAWADEAHPDPLAPIQGTKRKLCVWIWYPAATGQKTPIMDDYLPAPWRAADERASGVLLSQFLTRDLSKVHGHCVRNAEISLQQQSFPVVIMRAGSSGSVKDYSTLAEDLASHGYVVVGFDAPYRTRVVVFPDGRVIARTPENDPENFSGPALERVTNKLLAAWTADVSYVLDRLERLNTAEPSGKFTGRLDLARVGIFGHSFGGAQAAQFCHEDSRCKAGIDVDGAPLGSVVQEGIHQPFMFLLSDHERASDPESLKIKGDIRWIYERLPPQQRLYVTIRGAYHFGFSDDAVLKSHILLRMFRACDMVDIDGSRQLAVTAYGVSRFFDAYLKDARVSPLKIACPLFPEIQIIE